MTRPRSCGTPGGAVAPRRQQPQSWRHRHQSHSQRQSQSHTDRHNSHRHRRSHPWCAVWAVLVVAAAAAASSLAAGVAAAGAADAPTRAQARVTEARVLAQPLLAAVASAGESQPDDTTGMHVVPPPPAWCKQHVYHPHTGDAAGAWVAATTTTTTTTTTTSAGGPATTGEGRGLVGRRAMWATARAHACLLRSLSTQVGAKKGKGKGVPKQTWRRWLELCDVRRRVAGGSFMPPPQPHTAASAAATEAAAAAPPTAVAQCFAVAARHARGRQRGRSSRGGSSSSSAVSGGLASVDVGTVWDYVGPFPIGKGVCVVRCGGGGRVCSITSP